MQADLRADCGWLGWSIIYIYAQKGPGGTQPKGRGYSVIRAKRKFGVLRILDFLFWGVPRSSPNLARWSSIGLV